MKSKSWFSVDKSLIAIFIAFAFISVIAISSSLSILPDFASDIVYKQILWFGLGIILILFIMKTGNEYFYRHATILYGVCIALLVFILLFGIEVNGATRWFSIPFLGNFQPSEFMKLALILMLGKVINEFNENSLQPSSEKEFKLISKCFLLTLIPSFLILIQPDTGGAMMMFVIMLVMLFVGGVSYKWFGMFALAATILATFFIGIYFINDNLFISLFGTGSFYRLDRILNWAGNDSLQLTNALMAMGSSGIIGSGHGNIPIHFPEAATDFIFSVIASSWGLIGAIVLILIYIAFFIKITGIINKTTNNLNKYIGSGILGILVFSTIYNISMNLGLVPIIGLPLPFISYGGSSIFTAIIMLAIIFNINNENIRFTN